MRTFTALITALLSTVHKLYPKTTSAVLNKTNSTFLYKKGSPDLLSPHCGGEGFRKGGSTSQVRMDAHASGRKEPNASRWFSFTIAHRTWHPLFGLWRRSVRSTLKYLNETLKKKKRNIAQSLLLFFLSLALSLSFSLDLFNCEAWRTTF